MTELDNTLPTEVTDSNVVIVKWRTSYHFETAMSPSEYERFRVDYEANPNDALDSHEIDPSYADKVERSLKSAEVI